MNDRCTDDINRLSVEKEGVKVEDEKVDEVKSREGIGRGG